MKAGYDWIKNKEIQMLLEMALASVRLKTWARRRSPLTTRHKAGRWQQVGGGGLEWFRISCCSRNPGTRLLGQSLECRLEWDSEIARC